MKTTHLFQKIGTAIYGGTFVSIITGTDSVSYALVKLDVQPQKAFEDNAIGLLPWNEAIAWAEKLDVNLPTRAEAELMRANVPASLLSETWTEDEHPSDNSEAYVVDFLLSDSRYIRKDAPAEVIAIRRVPLDQILAAMSAPQVRRAKLRPVLIAEAA